MFWYFHYAYNILLFIDYFFYYPGRGQIPKDTLRYGTDCAK